MLNETKFLPATGVGYFVPPFSLDDSISIDDAVSTTGISVQMACALFSKLGFHPVDETGRMAPKQVAIYLGFTLILVTMTIYPKEKRLLVMRRECQALLSAPVVTLKLVARVVGFLVAMLPGVCTGQLHYRRLEHFLTQRLAVNARNYQTRVSLSTPARADALWWLHAPSIPQRRWYNRLGRPLGCALNRGHMGYPLH